MSTLVSTIVCCAAVCFAQPGERLHQGKDLAHWRAKVQPPFSFEERTEAITAVQILGNLGVAHDRDKGTQWLAEEIVPTFISLLKDSEAQIRYRATIAHCNLDRTATIAAIPELTRLLKDSDDRVRDAAVSSFVFRGEQAEPAIPLLIDLVEHDKSPLARRTAAMALRTSDTAGIAALQGLLSSPKTAVRSAAVSAFENTYPQMKISKTPASLSPRLVELLDDEDKGIQSSAALALMRCAPLPVEVIPKLLKHQNADVRDRTVTALLIPSQAKPVPCVDEILAAVTEDLQLRRRHASLIGRLGPTTIPLLVELLTDGDAKVRGRAADGLGTLGPAAIEAAPALKKLLTDMAIVYGDSKTRV